MVRDTQAWGAGDAMVAGDKLPLFSIFWVCSGSMRKFGWVSLISW